MAAGRVLLALCTVFSYLIDVGVCQQPVVEQPLSCYQTSTTCAGSEATLLPYSDCCATGTESFLINGTGTCYSCSDLLSFTAPNYTVNERDRYISLGVVRTVNPGTNIFFFNTVINDNTALAGIDYGQFPDSGVGFINIVLEGESLVRSGVVIIDDNIVEHKENFTVSLQPLSRDFQPLGGLQDTALVTIIDDDMVDITLDPPGPLTVNESSSLVFYLNSTGQADRAVQVLIDLSEEELEFSDESLTSVETFTFEPSDPPKRIEIVVLDDDVVEATETHLIRLRVPEGETGVNLPRDSVDISVLDDGDTVQLSLPEAGDASLRVVESDGTISIPLTKTGSNERPVFVRVLTEPISAQAGADYGPIDMVLEVSSVDTLLITTNTSADGIVEAEEMFRIRLEVPASESGVQLGVSEATVLLVDADVLTVDISTVDLTVAEGDNVTFLVSGRGATLDRDVSISITHSSVRDISVFPSTVMLRPGQLQANVTVTGLDDDLYEGAESAELTITSSDSKAVEFSSPSPTINIDIVDSDPPMLSFSESAYQFNETAGSVEISVLFNASTETSHSWTLTSLPLSATEGEDYTGIEEVLVFDDSTRNHTVQFTVKDDLLSEGIESFSLELRDQEGQLTVSALVEILDDEKLLISFTDSVFTVSEGEQLFYLPLNKSGVTTSDITIQLNITDGSAQGGIDYGFFPTSVFPALTLILASETSVRYPIPIKNDDIIEKTENFSVTITIRNNDGTIILGNISSAVVFIEDDDKVSVGLVGGGEVEEGGSEEERQLTFVVTRDGNVTLDREVSLVLSTSNGSATGSATESTGDYVESAVSFNFTNTGPLSFTTTVSVLDDMIVEGRENFTVSLSPSPGETALILPQNPSTVYIIDNDKIQVDFVEATYRVGEGDGNVTVMLKKEGRNEIPVTVSVVFRTMDDTAVAYLDYNVTIEPVEFQRFQNQVNVTIPILDDNTVEDIESFTVVLNVTDDDSNVELGPDNTTRITIIDDDSVAVEFEEVEYRGLEGEDVTVSIVLTGTIVRNVEIRLNGTAGSANVSDFSLRSETVTFSPGQERATVAVSLTQDTMCDAPEESFTIDLEIVDSGVSLGLTNTTQVFIEDDDECGIQFINETMVNVNETDEDIQISLCVGVSSGFQLEREVRFIVVAEELIDMPVEQQALSNVDFEFNTAIKTLDPSDRMLCFNVTILEDNRPDGRKFFNVSIVLEDQNLVSSRAEVTVAIGPFIPTPTPLPGVPAVQFSTDVYSVRESDGAVEITLTVFPPPNDTTILRSVVFNTVNGTATAPSDYAALVDTSVTIEGSSATVLVVIVSDGVGEGDEQFTVRLSLPEMLIPRVRLGTRTTATVVIDDTGPEDKFVEDTVTGDPFFIVPLSLTPNSAPFRDNTSLCYEIHGSPGSTFNLISDTCTSVNALYSVSSVDNRLNFISEIGVKAVDLNGDCVDIRVAVDNNCTVEIRRGNDDITVLPRFESGGITVRQSAGSVRISVSNCANSRLVMWVKCREVNGQPQLRFDITRGLNLNPTSHGLLGQFWNIPVTVTSYTFTGPIVYDLQSQELYLVAVHTPDGSETSRQFVAEFSPLSWDHNRPESCLFAGDQQGGRTLEFSTHNDPVIENNYRLYRTGGLFDTQFHFARFDASRCNG